MRTLSCSLAIALLFISHSTQAADLKVHVFDIGGGLCTLTVTPDGGYMVYDAGVGLKAGSPKQCAERIDETMPAGAEIDLLILSHSDADHISSVTRLLELRTVNAVARTGHERANQTWCKMDYWIKVKVDGGQPLSQSTFDSLLDQCKKTGQPMFVRLDPYPPDGNVDFNLLHYELRPGEEVYTLGSGEEATVTLLHGLHDIPRIWDKHFMPKDHEISDLSTREMQTLTSRRRNAISIIAKLEYKDRSVLFTGDSVGLDLVGEKRLRGRCVGTERSLVDGHTNQLFSLDSDVLIAPHHGSSNGSCLDFIKLVSPGWAIFTAGHNHHHPAKTAVERYEEAGVSHLLRTDRGDNESGDHLEWDDDLTPDGDLCKDRPGDDDVLITLKPDGSTPTVKYADVHTATCS